MPSFPAADGRKGGYFITWRAKWLAMWSGEMAVSDWLPPGVAPDRPLPWDARVRIMNRMPVVYIGTELAGLMLWPDGKTTDMAIPTIGGGWITRR